MDSFDARFYLSIFWRRLPFALVIASAIAAIGITTAYLLPPVFRATSKILIESPQIPEGLARSTVPVGGIEQIQIIEQQLMTSSTLLELAGKYGVDASQPGLSPAEIIDNMRSRTTFGEIPFDTSPRGGATAFAVSFDAPAPELAAKVASEIAQQILKENVRLRTGLATDTLDFFQQDVKRLGAELSKLEAEILAFKNKNKDALPDSLEFRRSEQSIQQERLVQLQREEAALRDRRSTLVKTFENTTVAVDAAHPASPEEEILTGLRKTLVEQQLVYSDQSPNILLLRAQIAKLEEEIRAQRAAQRDGTVSNKAPTEYEIQLAEIDGRLSYIGRERATIEQVLAALRQSILATPTNEVTLNSLERNHRNFQLQYNTATAKLAEASTGEQIELRSKGVRFSVIELATPPQKPLSSKRFAIAGGSVFAGAGLGLAFIVLMEALTRGVRRPADLVQGLEIMPLATIPYVRIRSETRQRRLVFGVAMLVVAVLLPAAIVALHDNYMPIDLWLRKLTMASGRMYR
jgi:polysaccharide biosynthesis transport protein